jgi:hypothetical protein
MEKDNINFLIYNHENYVSKTELDSKIKYLDEQFIINNKEKDHFDHSQYWCGLRDISSQLNWVSLPNMNGDIYAKKVDLINLIKKEKKAKLTTGISKEYLMHMELAFNDLENLISV